MPVIYQMSLSETKFINLMKSEVEKIYEKWRNCW